MGSVQLREHFEQLSASLTLMWCCKSKLELNFLHQHFLTPNFPPAKQPKWSFFERILFSRIPAVGEASKNRIGKARRDAEWVIFTFTPDFAKISVRQCTNVDFSQKFQTQRHIFVIHMRFLAVS